MANVVFSIGNHPELEEHDALELAQILDRTRNLAAVRAARKISDRARLHPRDTAMNVELDESEMIEIYALLGAPSATPISDAVSSLHRELAAALGAS